MSYRGKDMYCLYLFKESKIILRTIFCNGHSHHLTSAQVSKFKQKLKTRNPLNNCPRASKTFICDNHLISFFGSAKCGYLIHAEPFAGCCCCYQSCNCVYFCCQRVSWTSPPWSPKRNSDFNVRTRSKTELYGLLRNIVTLVTACQCISAFDRQTVA